MATAQFKMTGAGLDRPLAGEPRIRNLTIGGGLWKRIAAAVLMSFFGIYVVLPFFRYNEGEGGGLYDCYLMGDRQQADLFFDKLETILKAEDFQLTNGPTTGGNGIVSSPEGQTYWFHGSYRGSLPITVAVMRSGPQLTCFHLSYAWDNHGFRSIRDEMRRSTDALSAFLRDWAENHDVGDFYNRK